LAASGGLWACSITNSLDLEQYPMIPKATDVAEFKGFNVSNVEMYQTSRRTNYVDGTYLIEYNFYNEKAPTDRPFYFSYSIVKEASDFTALELMQDNIDAYAKSFEKKGFEVQERRDFDVIGDTHYCAEYYKKGFIGATVLVAKVNQHVVTVYVDWRLKDETSFMSEFINSYLKSLLSKGPAMERKGIMKSI
jgi:hypothetical protein